MAGSKPQRRGFLAASVGVAGAALAQDRPKAPASREISFQTPDMPWKPEIAETLHRSYLVKYMIRDADTGMEVLMVRYPAGLVIPLHTHPCAHGMYVVEGVLVTDEGRYPPGSFIWFPEGLRMKHGATAEQDVTVLFMTNKPFGITYV
jgi:quercetin dioxygenase-like cupin family protein